MTNRIFLALALFALPSLVAQADERQAVTVGGQSVAGQAVRLTFSGDEVTLTFSDGATLTSDMEAVRIDFNWEVPTAVEAPVALPSQQPAAAYDLQGRRVEQPTRGLYIVNRDGRAVKVVKR